MATKSLRGRGLSLSSRMASPSLHSIIVDTKAQSTDISQYFSIKREKGVRAVPKAVLNAAVILELTNKLKTSSDMRTCVACVVVCMEEFSTNYDVKEPWNELPHGISELLLKCLNFFVESKKNDTFIKCSKTFVRFCNLLACIAEYSEELCTRLFNKCSKALFNLLFATNMTVDLKSVILYALSTLCQHAKLPSTAEAFSSVAVHLKYLAQNMIMKLPVETQMSAYYILHSSLISSKQEAVKAASIWFCKWPTLKDTFVTCYEKSVNEGCGIFLNKLHEVKTSGDEKSMQHTLATRSTQGKTPSSTQMQTSHQTTTERKIYQSDNSKASYKGDSSSHKPDAELFKKPAAFKVSVDFKTPVAFHETESEISKPSKIYQTPYYPDRRKSLALRQKASTTNVQGTGSSQFHQDDEQILLERGGSKPAQRHTNSTYQPKLQKFEEGEFEQFDMSRSSQSRKEYGNRSASHKVNTEKLKAEVKIEDLEHEDENSKVKRWLSDSCSGGNMLSGSADEDVQIISPEPKYSADMGQLTCQQRHASVFSTKSRRFKEDSPQMSMLTVDSSLTFNQYKKSDEEPAVGLKCEDVHSKMRKRKLYSNNEATSADPIVQQKPTSRGETLWEKKLRELETAAKKQKEVKDVYFFRELTSGINSNYLSPLKSKKPKAVARKTPAVRTNTTQNGQSTESTRRRKLDKENIQPKSTRGRETPDSFFKSGSGPKKFKKNVESMTPAIKEPFALTAYSPAFNDSVESVKLNQSKIPSAQGPNIAVMREDVQKSASAIRNEYMAPSTIVKPGLSAPLFKGGQGINCTVGASNSIRAGGQPPKVLTSPANASRICDGSVASNSTRAGGQPSKFLPSPANATQVLDSSAASCITKLGGQLFKSPMSPVNASRTSGEVAVSGSTKKGGQLFQSPISTINASGTSVGVVVSGSTKKCGQLFQSPTSPVDASCSRDLDSGVDVTSNDEGYDPKTGSKKSKIFTAEYFRMQLKLLKDQAAKSNSQLTTNNTAISSEMVEIKGLAAKIADSVSRCETVVSSNRETLSDEAAALQGYSRVIEEAEDPADIYREQRRRLRAQLQARNNERIMNAIKMAIESNGIDSSDSE